MLPQVNFPANNLIFHWRWLDRIQVIFFTLFYFKSKSDPLEKISTYCVTYNLYTFVLQMIMTSGLIENFQDETNAKSYRYFFFTNKWFLKLTFIHYLRLSFFCWVQSSHFVLNPNIKSKIEVPFMSRYFVEQFRLTIFHHVWILKNN